MVFVPCRVLAYSPMGQNMGQLPVLTSGGPVAVPQVITSCRHYGEGRVVADCRLGASVSAGCGEGSARGRVTDGSQERTRSGSHDAGS